MPRLQGLTQDQSNKALIIFCWTFLFIYSIGMAVCLLLWATNHISDRAMIGVTLALSWLALIESRGTSLLQSYVKRDMDS